MSDDVDDLLERADEYRKAKKEDGPSVTEVQAATLTEVADDLRNARNEYEVEEDGAGS